MGDRPCRSVEGVEVVGLLFNAEARIPQPKAVREADALAGVRFLGTGGVAPRHNTYIFYTSTRPIP